MGIFLPEQGGCPPCAVLGLMILMRGLFFSLSSVGPAHGRGSARAPLPACSTP